MSEKDGARRPCCGYVKGATWGHPLDCTCSCHSLAAEEILAPTPPAPQDDAGANPPPRYDEVYFEGVAALDALAGPPIPEGALVEVAPSLADRLAEALKTALVWTEVDVARGPAHAGWSDMRSVALGLLAEYRERKEGHRG